MKVNAVIFDMDGLLLDTERLAALAYDYAGEAIGIGRAGYMIDRVLGCTVTAADAILAAEFGNRYDASAFAAKKREFTLRYEAEHGVPVKPYAREIIANLKSREVKLALASSTYFEIVKRQLSAIGLFDSFDAIITGDTVARSKPAPDIYLRACEALGVLPAEALALEDGKNGILSAHAAGCRVIMVPDLWQPDGEVRSIVYAVASDLGEAMRMIDSDAQE